MWCGVCAFCVPIYDREVFRLKREKERERESACRSRLEESKPVARTVLSDIVRDSFPSHKLCVVVPNARNCAPYNGRRSR